MQSCRFWRNCDIFSLKRKLIFSQFCVNLKRKDYSHLTSAFNMENKAGNGNEATFSEAGSGEVVKSASQLKKEAKRLEKLEKFKKKKEAQEAEKTNQTEVNQFINTLNIC